MSRMLGNIMDWKFFLQLVVTFLVAALGWWAAHAFTSRRDITNERRKVIVQLLLEAYRKLEDASNREDIKANWCEIESAIADIQLLGSKHQVSLAFEFSKSMAKARSASLDPLLCELRDSLRSELQLDPDHRKSIFSFRYIEKP
jgi:hypothetical protein